MHKEITVGDRKFVVRELLGVEADTINWEDKLNALKRQVILSTGITEEDYNGLTLKERLYIIKTINEINGLEGFQLNSQTDKKQ